MHGKEQRNRLLDFLTAPVKPAGEASRTNRRRRSSARILLSWSKDGEWKTIPGRLRDISRAGAGLLATVAPPASGIARLRLAEGEETPWLEAEILGVDQERVRRYRVRLRFLSPCPSFMLQPAVLGEDAVEDQPNASILGWATYTNMAE